MSPTKAEIDQSSVIKEIKEARGWIEELISQTETRNEYKIEAILIDGETAHLTMFDNEDMPFCVLADNNEDGFLPLTVVDEDSEETLVIVNWGKEIGERKYPLFDAIDGVSEGRFTAYKLATTYSGGVIVGAESGLLDLFSPEFLPALKEKLERVTNQE